MQDILNFSNVSWAPEDAPSACLQGVSFSLPPARLAVISSPSTTTLPPIADIASGLVEPDTGTITFMDQTWPEMSPYQAALSRGAIGRIFSTHRWVSNLSMKENLLLQQRHHSQRSEEILQNEVESLARQVALPAIPAGRPENVKPADLRRLQWVRAFMGTPRLILMEEPESGLSAHELEPLTRLIDTALTRGTAIVWLTTTEAPAAGIRRPGVQRFRLEAGALTVVAEAI
jgi:phospholipid/cholesterol/gamma-HCH transport system ATP-binding protein